MLFNQVVWHCALRFMFFFFFRLMNVLLTNLRRLSGLTYPKYDITTFQTFFFRFIDVSK